MSIVGSKVDGSVAMLVWGGGRSSALDQKLDETKVSTESGKVDRSATHVVLEGGVSPGLHQQLSTVFKPIGNLKVWHRRE